MPFGIPLIEQEGTLIAVPLPGTSGLPLEAASDVLLGIPRDMRFDLGSADPAQKAVVHMVVGTP